MRSNAYILMPELLVRLVSPRHPRHAHLGRGEASRANQSYLFGGKWGAGDVKYEDLNNDNKINIGNNTLSDPGDRKNIGNSTPRYAQTSMQSVFAPLVA